MLVFLQRTQCFGQKILLCGNGKNLAVKILEDQFLARIKGSGFFMALHSTVLKVHGQIVFLFGLMNIKMKKLSYSKNQ